MLCDLGFSCLSLVFARVCVYICVYVCVCVHVCVCVCVYVWSEYTVFRYNYSSTNT